MNSRRRVVFLCWGCIAGSALMTPLRRTRQGTYVRCAGWLLCIYCYCLFKGGGSEEEEDIPWQL